MGETNAVGRIAARIDRLPLTWVQWRLALISQLFWGVIIAADGIPAKVYPYVWLPQHAFGMTAFSLLLAMQFGVGILIGEYLIGLVADRWGRRLALLISTLTIALLDVADLPDQQLHLSDDLLRPVRHRPGRRAVGQRRLHG